MNISEILTGIKNWVVGKLSDLATIVNAKAPLASPALTGTPTAPTAAAGTNTTQIATTAFVNTAIDNLPKPMQFKGSLGTGGTITSLPAASESNIGWTYQVITAGTYAGQTADVGDVFISTGTEWTLIPSGDEPTGTVTSVGAGTGLSISGNPAINPTVNVATGYKLPTTAEWEEKEDTFWATYSTTSYADILAAHNAGKVVLCNISGTIAQLTSVDSTNNKVTFTAEHPNGVLSVDVNASGWSVPSSVSFEKTPNKVTTLSSSSTDTQYPSAKVVYDTAEELRGSDAEIQENIEQSVDDGASVYQSAQKFLFRKTGGDSLVMDANNGLIKSIKGRTLVWNQLVQNGDFADGTTGWSGGGTVADGVYSVTWPTNYSNNGIYQGINQFRTIAGHQYYVHAWIQHMGAAQITYYLGIPYKTADAVSRVYAQNEAAVLEGIYTAETASPADGTGNAFKLFATVGGDASIKLANYFIVDLTLLGWVPSTVDEFRAVYPLSYYSYTPALMKNNAATDLESTGFNQWDEIGEVGQWANINGKVMKVATTNHFRNANPIRVIPGTTIYIKCPVQVFGFFADEQMNFISVSNGNNTERGVPTGAAFFCYRLDAAYGTTYNHDICVNLSDPDRNGTYEPYWKATRHLGLDNLQAKEVGTDTIVTINGLDGVGDNVDLLKEGKYIEKNRARVDLGTLNWAYQESRGVFIADAPEDSASVVSGTGVPAICAKYAQTTTTAIWGGTASDKSFCLNGGVWTSGKRVGVKDSAYTDAAAFKTAMAGVILDYPLATPKEYELVEPINTNYRVDKGGTEKFLLEQTASVILPPVECDMKYKNIGVEGYKLITDAMWDSKANLAGSSTQDFAAKDLTVSHIKYNGQTFNLNPTQGGQLALTTDIPLAQAQPQVVEDTTNKVRFFNGTIIMDKDAASTITYDLHDFFDYYCRSLGINPDDSTRYGNLGLKCFALTDFLYNSKIIKEHIPVQQQTGIYPYIRTLSTYSRDVAVNVLSVYNLTITYKASDSTTSHLYLEVNGDSSGMQVRITNS